MLPDEALQPGSQLRTVDAKENGQPVIRPTPALLDHGVPVVAR
jgi:hypothetical protein